jgi:hypothetical protein
MSSFIGNKPHQVPTNGDLGRFAYLNYLGIEDIGASIPTIASAATIAPTVKITYVSGTTSINAITPPADLINGGQITLIPTGAFSLTTSGNIAIGISAEVSKAIVLTYNAALNEWYPSYSNTVNRMTFNGTSGSTLTLGTGGTVTYTKDKLSTFSLTSSSEFASVISDGSTGSGAIVLATSPTLVTPVLGVASATTVNKVTITAPSAGSTLTINNGKVLTVGNTVSFLSSDSTVLSGVAITSVNGEFSCTAGVLSVGNQVIIAGTNTGTGVVAAGTYYVIVTNNSSTFQLSATYSGTAITTTAGTVIGVTFTLLPTVILRTGGTVAYKAIDKLSEFAATTSAELASVITDETGTGSLVFANTPTLVTPSLGAATAISINGLTITTTTAGSLTIANSKTLTANTTVTLSGTGGILTVSGDGTLAFRGDKLSVFAATTSAELASTISDETGFSTTGLLMFNNNPTVVTGIVADSASTTFNLINTNATTLNIGGAASAGLNLGYSGTAASTTNISTGAVAASTIKSINIGTSGAASSTTNIVVGASAGGTTTLNSPTIAAGSASLDLFTTTAATLNFASAATTLTIGYTGTAGSTTHISNGATATGTTKTVNIGTNNSASSTATINIGTGTGFTSNVTIGSLSAGLTTVNYNLEVMQNISAHQNVTAYYSSDKRLKENITPIQNPLEKILKLSGNTFKWTAEHYATQNQKMVKEFDVGVIAQEVLEVMPEAVHERDNGMLAVDYQKLVPLLIECIKAQQEQINSLLARG